MPTRALRTVDGTVIDACHDPARDGATPGLGIVVAHGFTGGWRRPAVRRAVEALAGTGGVVSFDFRGHGRSGGASTVGDREVLDLAAAVAWAHELGYARVATVGFSMGASVVIRHAALHPGASRPSSGETPQLAGGSATVPISAVVAISGPSRWYYRGTVPMRRVHWVIERRMGRAVSRLALRTRIDPHGWPTIPESPHEVVARIAPVPVLIVHGDADHYFPVEHAKLLYACAAEPKELWIEAGFGHAENAASPELLGRIGAWLAEHG